jgi:hypothetical protein
MYGLVNRAIEQLVTATAGSAAWSRVCQQAHIGDEGFISMCPYHDDLTYQLVGAAAKELQLTPQQVLEAFGEYWILYTAEEGYGELLNAGGDNLRDFMLGLNDMHGRVETVFPEMRLPHFAITDLSPTTFEVHYQSEREGLAPMVCGLITGLARRFNQTVVVQQVAAKAGAGAADVFRVEVT